MSDSGARFEHINFATFHRDDIRHETFRNGFDAPHYDTFSRTWMVLDPWMCIELLNAPGLRAVNVPFHGLESRFALDLAPLRDIDAQVPLYKEGEEHARVRRRFTERLVERRGLLRSWIENESASFLVPLVRAGEVEVVSDILRPMIRSFLTVLTGIDIKNGPPTDLMSLFFDGSLSLKRRLMVFDQVVSLRNYVKSQVRESVPREDIDMMVVLTMFGQQPLQHTYGESLKRMVEENPGLEWREMLFPHSPPQTGVPFFERVATEPVNFRGIEISSGERIRFFTQGFGYFDELTDLHRFFGAGAHACIGRPISVELWRRIVSVLSTSAIVPQLQEYQVDTDNYLFTGPKILRLRLNAGERAK